jgi:Dicarboxylate transport
MVGEAARVFHWVYRHHAVEESLRRRVLGTAVIAAVLTFALFTAYVWRRSIAAVMVERYLATLGVTSKIEIVRLNLSELSAHVRLGSPASPDATASIDGSIAWAGLTPAIRSLHVSAAHVRARFDGRRLSLGSEDRLVDLILSRPSGRAPPPDITVDETGVIVETPQGRIELTGDAMLRSGVLRTLHARLSPGELRGANLTIGIRGGTIRIESNPDGLDLRAEAVGRVLANAHGVPARLEHLRVSADGAHLKLNTVRGLELTGPLKVLVEARNVEVGTLAADRITATVDAPTSRLLSSRPLIEADLLADLRAEGLRFPLDGGTAVIRQAQARIRGSVKSDSRQPEADVHADLHLAGEVSDGIARRLALRVPLSGSESSAVSVLVAATRALEATVEGVHATYSSGHLGLALSSPALLSGGKGLRMTLEPGASTGLLEGDLAAGMFRGAFKLRAAGSGVPSVRLAVQSYVLGVGNDGLPVVSARLKVGAHLSMGPLYGLTVAAEGRLQAEGGRYRVFIEDCADLRLDRFTLSKFDLVGVKTQLCGAQIPWFVGDERRWAVHSLWRSFSATLPLWSTAVANGTGRLDLSGNTRGVSGGELKIASLQMTDGSRAPRFAPLSVQGTVVLEDRTCAGLLELVLARSGQSLGRIRARHSLSAGSGEARIEIPGLEFAPGGLQPSMLSPLLQPLARAHGRTAFDGTLSWTAGNLSSHGLLRLENFGFSSAVGDVTQASANIELTSLVPLQSASHQHVAVGEIGTLLPLTELSGHFELLPTAVNIEDIRMNFAGGAITLDPATLPFDPKVKISATVRLQDIDLNKLVAASSLADRLKLDVHVSGAIPFSNSTAGLQVTHGSVSSTGPGRIEISRRIWSDDAQNTGNAIRDFAYQALEHLGVDELNGTINSLPDGRLGLILHIRGRHDPPVAVPTRIGILEFLRGHAFDRPVPLPKGTPIDLTLDSFLNFEGLLDTWRAASSAVHP